MSFIDGHVLFFANASEGTATNTFTIGIQAGARAWNAEIAEIVLGCRRSWPEERKNVPARREMKVSANIPRRLPSRYENEQASTVSITR